MNKQPGFIYILSNPSLKKMYKVGVTTRNPYERAEELSENTAVPTPFKVEYFAYVEDCFLSESILHRFLEQKGLRVSDKREFFRERLDRLKSLFLLLKVSKLKIRATKLVQQLKSLLQ